MALVGLLVGRAPLFAAGNRALLVGISQYADPEMNDLAYADEDVKTFGSILKNFADYKDSEISIILNDQATKQRIVGSIVELVKLSQTSPLEHFILMYAGHGLPSSIQSKRTNSFLAPHDAYLNQFFPEGAGDMLGNETFINKAWLIRQLSSMKAKNIVIILDSCYSGAKDFGTLYAENLGFRTEFLAGAGGKRGIVVVSKKDSDPSLVNRIAFLASSRESQPSAEYKELRHGALSYTLFEYLNGLRAQTDLNLQREVNVEDMYSGIEGLFDTVKVKGETLSKVHQPVLFSIPSYEEVKSMRFVGIRGVKIPEIPLLAQLPADPAPTGGAPAPSAKPPGVLVAKLPPAAPKPPPSARLNGELYLDTGEDACEVSFNGEKTGRLSNNQFELAEGKHLVSLYLPKTNYNQSFMVEVKAGVREVVAVSLRGRLAVESRPANPGDTAPELQVYLDGRSVGRTSLSLKNIVAGTHELRVVVNKISKKRKIEIRPESPLLVRYKITIKAGKSRDDGGARDVTF